MSNEELNKRIAAIENQQAIEKLRYRYWFAILDKNTVGMIDCFTEDALLEYGFGIEVKGQSAIDTFFQKLLHAEDLIYQIPRGANGMVDLIDGDHANGRWLVEVIVLKKGQEKGTRIGVQYFEQYQKIAEEWKISHIKNDYLFYEAMELKRSP